MTALLRDDAEAIPAAPPAAGADLFLDAGQLATRLHRHLREESWLDAFLASCALSQLVTDRLHPDPAQLQRAASYLAGVDAAWARGAAGGARGIAAVLRRLPRPVSRRLAAAGGAFAELTVALADRVLHPEKPRSSDPRLRLLTAGVSPVTSLLGDEPARLPACFQAFNLTPDDVVWLADRYRASHPWPAPVVVVGVRTSGSYLAPLLAAALADGGEPAPRVLTIRPHRPLLPPERRQLTAVTDEGGRVLVIDDPPGAGTALATTAADLCRAGAPREALTLVLPLFSADEALPPALQALDAVVQPFPRWAVHQQLAPAAVRASLEALLGPAWRIDHVEAVELPAIGARRAVRARYQVERVHLPTGERVARDVVVEGTGLGYLGAPASAAATSLRDHLPPIHGLRDGLLYLDSPPADDPPIAGHDTAAAIAGYVADRAARFAVRADPTPRMRGREPAWEAAGALLARPYGPLAPFAQMALFAPLTRRLLSTATPAVLDGATDLTRWLPDVAQGGRLAKVDFHQHAFSHLDLASYDPVSDLAGAAGIPDHPGFAAELRAAYEKRTGQPVDPERWLLHRLLHARRRRRLDELTSLEAARHSAAAVNAYLAEIYGLASPAEDDGPLVALDLDGVLETDRLGYPATTPAGALVLRALRAHGYRSVVATGRSLDDARDRCAAFGLAGAVAEYGTALFVSGDQRVVDLRDPATRTALDRARDRLVRHPDARVDPGHRFAVRARGPKGPLAGAVLELPELAALVTVHGDGQTDLTAPGLTKATALQELAGRLGAAPIALAVGDSASDLPMLAVAGLAGAPANADEAVRRAQVPLARHAYQAGLSEIVASLLGHRPGGCPACRLPRPDQRTRAMLAALTTPATLRQAVPPAAVLAAGLLR